MADLQITQIEAAEYVSSLGVVKGTATYHTLAAMLQLSPTVFLRAVAALRAGLINFAGIRALPAVSDSYVDEYINGTLDGNSAKLLAWKYQNEWVPASINVNALMADAMGGDPLGYLHARYVSTEDLIVKPRYDFTRKDRTAFFTYTEAVRAYYEIVRGPVVTGIVDDFITWRAILNGAVAAADSCPIVAEVRRAGGPAASSVFLERPSWKLTTNMALILAGILTNVSPGVFKRYMETVAYPTMAEQNRYDDDESGLAGAVHLFESTPLAPLDSPVSLEWTLGVMRMSRVHLRRAYGIQDSYGDDRKLGDMLEHIAMARQAILSIRDVVASGMDTYQIVRG